MYIYDPVFRPRGPPPRMGWVSHLLGTCYPLDDLRSTHTPSKYQRARATYSHIYMCYVAASFICIYIYIYLLIYML